MKVMLLVMLEGVIPKEVPQRRRKLDQVSSLVIGSFS
jgi:hypothetical protein